MKTKRLVFKKVVFYGMLFNLLGDILMCKVYGSSDKVFPGGLVNTRDIAGYDDETWLRRFFGRAFEEQAGIPSEIIEAMIQSMPAHYITYSNDLSVLYVGIIIGKTDFKPKTAHFIRVVDFLRMVNFGVIKRPIKRLGLRAFISRDCPNESYQEIAVKVLKKEHK
ncbi:MAG: hypothetical protein WC998_03655 [Candidatus Paceibacterota bacterium]|jgi:hypothetical protein